MTLEEKTKQVREKKACFHCLRVGHFSKVCKNKPHCHCCGGGHHVVMCLELPKKKTTTAQVSEEGCSSGAAMSNHSTTGVLLQTLIVHMECEEKTCSFCALVDTGSQHSYISKKVVAVFKAKPKSELKMAHCLFGGVQTIQRTHHLYEVKISSMDGRFTRNITVMDQPIICGEIFRVPNCDWLQELGKVGISLTDVGNEKRDVNFLIGADIAGELFTGKMYPTSFGPVAMETKLGWNVMGKSRYVKPSADSSLLVTSLHFSNVDVQDLWRLDVLGITVPVESKSQKDLMESATAFLKDTVVVNKDGRYEISLPWIEGHPPVSNNRQLAEKSLKSVYK